MGDLRHYMSTALLRPFELYKPIIAAINGFALAGGSELLQATDIRIASANASFGLTETQRGLVPGGGSMVRLPRQIPYCKAMEILMTGDALSAEEAQRIGFVNEVVAPDELMPRAMAFADRLVRNGPLAVAAVKEAVLRTSGLPLEDAYGIEAEISGRVTRSRTRARGRAPSWRSASRSSRGAERPARGGRVMLSPIECVRQVVACDNARDAAGYRAIVHDDYVSYVHGQEQNVGAEAEVAALEGLVEGRERRPSRDPRDHRVGRPRDAPLHAHRDERRRPLRPARERQALPRGELHAPAGRRRQGTQRLPLLGHDGPDAQLGVLPGS